MNRALVPVPLHWRRGWSRLNNCASYSRFIGFPVGSNRFFHSSLAIV
jgi:hypothetical protein